jgi:hypothetical protein
MKKLLYYLIFASVCLPNLILANAVCTLCDTLIMRNGQTLLVTEVSYKNDKIRFRDCGDNEGVYKTISTFDVKKIKKHNKSAIDEVPISGVPKGSRLEYHTSEEKAKNLAKISLILGVGCGFCLFLMFTYNLFFLILLYLAMCIVGMIIGVKGMRATRGRPELRNARKMSQLGFGISTFFAGLAAVYIILAIILLALFW